MKIFIRFLGLALVVAMTCSSAFAQRTVVDSMINQGRMRTFRVYLPAKFHAPASRPLILHLHGYGSSGAAEQAFSNYLPIADTANFLIVYPDATLDLMGNRGWNVGWPGIGNGAVDDLQFLSTLIDTLHVRYAVDLSRVYASGLSLGGYMCYQLAWKMSNRIAAIASVSGSMYPGQYQICTPPRPIPVMEIHGTADQVIPYNGTVNNINTDTLMSFWVHHDHLIPLAGESTIPVAPSDGTSVMHFVWNAEVSSISCELYRVMGGAHVDWPAAAAPGQFSASSEIWRFFNKYTVAQFASVSAAAIASPSSSIAYPNPCTGVIHSARPGTLTVWDALGRNVMTSAARDLDVSALPNGFYLLRAEHNGVIRTEKLLKQ